jgi:hypothetical protein
MAAMAWLAQLLSIEPRIGMGARLRRMRVIPVIRVRRVQPTVPRNAEPASEADRRVVTARRQATAFRGTAEQRRIPVNRR